VDEGDVEYVQHFRLKREETISCGRIKCTWYIILKFILKIWRRIVTEFNWLNMGPSDGLLRV
jgi:hypothetical protein